MKGGAAISILMAALAAAAIANPACAAWDDTCPTNSEPIDTDRPNFTNSAIAVPYGSFQIENGVTWTVRNGSNVIDGSESRLRLGVAHCTELTLDVPNYNYAVNGPAASGFLDLKLGAKRQLPTLPGDFTLSAIGGLSFPTGANKVGGPGYNPFIQFPWQRNLTDNWKVAGMFTVTWFTSQPPQNPTLETTLSTSYDFWRDYSATIDYDGEYDHQQPRHILDTGLQFRITDCQQFDMQAGFGLNRVSPDHFFGFGYSIRFDDLYGSKSGKCWPAR